MNVWKKQDYGPGASLRATNGYRKSQIGLATLGHASDGHDGAQGSGKGRLQICQGAMQVSKEVSPLMSPTQTQKSRGSAGNNWQ